MSWIEATCFRSEAELVEVDVDIGDGEDAEVEMGRDVLSEKAGALAVPVVRMVGIR